MTGMNMERFAQRQEAANANSGMDFSDIPKVVVAQGQMVRLVGDFESVWEHFATLPTGQRPFYCDGPESDCPLCAVANEMTFSEDEGRQKQGKELKAKEKFYFNCLDRSPVGKAWHESQKKCKVLAQSAKAMNIGVMLFRGIGKVCDMLKQQGKNPDPNGYDICLSKEGSGFTTKYGAQFTGMSDPLTPEEDAYEKWPLKDLSKISPHSEREVAANTLMGRSAPAPKRDDAVDPAKAGAVGPTQAAQPEVVNESVDPGPAVAPVTQAAPVTAAPVQGDPEHAKPIKLKMPEQKSEYQDTTPKDGADPAIHMTVPCSKCGERMQFSMEDERDMKCHRCETVYSHPSKS